MRYNPLSGWSYYWLNDGYFDPTADRFTSLSSNNGFYLYNGGSSAVTLQMAVKEESFLDPIPDVYAGWNLVGYPGAVAPADLIDDVQAKSGLTAVILWVYRNGNWSVYLPDATASLVSPTPWIDTVDASEGVWILME